MEPLKSNKYKEFDKKNIEEPQKVSSQLGRKFFKIGNKNPLEKVKSFFQKVFNIFSKTNEPVDLPKNISEKNIEELKSLPQDQSKINLIKHEKERVFIDNKNDNLSLYIINLIKEGQDEFLVAEKQNFEIPNWNVLPKKNIDYKLVGFAHVFGIKGNVYIDSEEVSLERGSYTDMPKDIADSFDSFVSQKEAEDQKFYNSVKETLVSSKNYSSDRFDVEKALKDFEAGKPVAITTGWFGHAVQVTLYKDSDGKAYLAYTNRGERRLGEALQNSKAKLKIYEIPDPTQITREFLEKLNIFTSSSTTDDKKNARMEYLEGKGLIEELHLKKIGEIEKKDQKVGNCSYANSKGGVHASLFFMYLSKFKKEMPNNEQELFTKASEKATVEFKQWEFFDRSRQLHELINLRKEVNHFRLSNRDYFMVLANAFGKVADKAKHHKYSTGIFKNSGIKERFEADLQAIEDFSKNSDIPIGEVASVVTDQHFLKKAIPGAFHIRKKEDSSFSIRLRLKVGSELFKLTPVPEEANMYIFKEKKVKIESLKDLISIAKDAGIDLKYPVMSNP